MISFTQIGWFGVSVMMFAIPVSNIVKWGFPSINGMVVAAVIDIIGQKLKK